MTGPDPAAIAQGLTKAQTGRCTPAERRQKEIAAWFTTVRELERGERLAGRAHLENTHD